MKKFSIKERDKISRWRSHIGMCEEATFMPYDKKTIMALFEADVDYEISKAKKSHWITVRAKWKNLGCCHVKPKK